MPRAHLFGGFQYNADSGMYFGAGVTYTASYYLHRRDFTVSEDSDFDRLGLQVRIGYHPSGVRNFAAPAATVQPGAPTTPPAPANRPPTVKARCEPCTVEVGRQLTASADAQDPDGDTLRYRWTRRPARSRTPPIARRRGPLRARWARCR